MPNNIMPAGHREFKEDLSPDKTPINSYSIKLSERDVRALERLKSRNGAGIGNITTENIALWKMIDQVCDTPEWLAKGYQKQI
jgi:hypothetical protein